MGPMVPIGSSGFAVTEHGAEASKAWNGYSLGQWYDPRLTFERWLDGEGSVEERDRVRADFETRIAAYASGQMTGEDAAEALAQTARDALAAAAGEHQQAKLARTLGPGEQARAAYLARTGGRTNQSLAQIYFGPKGHS